MLDKYSGLPLVAILRGLTVAEVPAAGQILFGAGFRLLEVPLNRPGALEAIAGLVRIAPEGAIVGGGTMLTEADVDAVAAAGGRMFVSPNCNPSVIRHARAAGMLCAPGVATPSEAFAALEAGAHALKIFPAEMVGTPGLKAMKTVLPPGTAIWPVGGIVPDSMRQWTVAGATGFGIGSALYAPGLSPDALERRAREFIASANELNMKA